MGYEENTKFDLSDEAGLPTASPNKRPVMLKKRPQGIRQDWCKWLIVA